MPLRVLRTLLLLLIASGLALAADCPAPYGAPGTYTLTEDYSGAPNSASPVSGTACIKIAADDIVLDCAGHSITNNGTGGTTIGIVQNGTDNLTLKNCDVSGFTYGIYSHRSNRSSFESNNVSASSQIGIYMRTSGNNSLSGNRISGSTLHGIYVYVSSGSNNFSGNDVYGNTQHGIYLDSGGDWNRFNGNSVHGNGQQGYYLSFSRYNVFQEENISGNGIYGLYMRSNSHWNNISDSNISTMSGIGVRIDTSANNTFKDNGISKSEGGQGLLITASSPGLFQNSIDGTNTINGLPIYLRSQLDGNCPSGDLDLGSAYSWAGLVGCDEVNMTSDPGNVMDHVLIAFSNGTNVSRTRVAGSLQGYGFYAYRSEDARIEDTYAGNMSRGYYFSYSPDAVVLNGDAQGSQYGYYCDNSHRLSIEDSQALNYSSTGYYIYNCSNTTFERDLALQGGTYGFFIYQSPGAAVAHSNASGHSSGAFFVYSGSDRANITGNRATTSGFGFALTTFSNSTVSDNVAEGNSIHGFLVTQGSNSSNFSNNSASGNTQQGFFIQTGSSDNTFRGLRAEANGWSGIEVETGSGNSLSDVESQGNAQHGILVDHADGTIIEDAHLYNNTLSEFRLSALGGQTAIVARNMTFDNPSGSHENETSISITDDLESLRGYDIEWVPEPGSMPDGYGQFAGKFVNISNISANDPLIDSIAFSWSEEDLAGLDETRLRIYKYNGSWSDTEAVLDASANTLNLTGMSPKSTYGILQSLENCPIIDVSGSYGMNYSYQGAPNGAYPFTGTACVVITASDVLFDCQGLSITENGTGGTTSGIVVNESLSNVTVRDCDISNYTYGINANGSVRLNITNHSIHDCTSQGLAFTSINDSYVGNMTFRNNSARGMQIQSGCLNNTFEDMEISLTTRGVVINSGADNRVSGLNIHDVSGRGLFLNNANNTTVSDCVVSNSGQYGFSLSNANLTNASRVRLYNNTLGDFMVTSLTYDRILKLTDITFDNPGGSGENSTNVSIEDVLEAGTTYTINWSAMEPAPAGKASFAGKSINISNYTSTISIDSLALTWTDGELAEEGADETLFEMWLYDGAWSDAGASLDASGNSLDLSAAGGAIYGILYGTGCRVISAPGAYTQGSDYEGAPNSASPFSGSACLVIASSDVVFDCAGRSIADNGTAGDSYGVLVNHSLTNVTVENCDVSGYTYGITSSQSNQSVYRNNSIHGNERGLLLTRSSNNTVEGNDLYSNSVRGMYLYMFSDDNIIIGNNATDCGASGFYLQNGCEGNLLSGNIAQGALRGYQILNSSNNNLTDDEAHGSSLYGFVIQGGSSGTRIQGGASEGNTLSGLHITDSDGSVVEDLHMYGNGASEIYLSSSSDPMDVSLTNATIDRPAGDHTAYTSIDLSDTLTNEAYNISWASSPGGEPENHVSLAGKYLDISADYGSVSIDSISFLWTDDESAGENESAFSVWKHNGTWSQLTGALDSLLNSLTLSDLVPGSVYGILNNLAPTDSSAIELSLFNVTETKLPRYDPGAPGNLSIEGGNMSNADIEGTALTDRWAAFFGNVSGTVFLGSNTSSVYEWLWEPDDGGAVCLSTDSGYDGTNVSGAQASQIDAAWGFSGLEADSAGSTFNDSSCDIGIGYSGVFNCTSTDTGAAGGFMTCAIKTEAAVPAKDDLLFCTRINGSGLAYNGAGADFELMVPTPYGSPGLETYFFYANLD